MVTDKPNIRRAFKTPRSFDKEFAARLNAAFQELRENGILALHDWMCCRNCGGANLPDNYADTWRGVVFYHAQGTEAAPKRGELCLYWTTPHKKLSVFGAEICASLRKHGLVVTWDGSPATAIAVVYPRQPKH